MGIYTSEGLVKHAEAALKLKTKYMWGGILRLIERQYDLLYSIYSKTSGTGYSPARWKELRSLFGKNYYGVDCVGLIKSYYWSGKPDGGTGSPGYCSDEYPDKSAADMYSLAKVKGKIKDLPEIPGLIVYDSRTHHVGIYIGGGYTIESTLGSRGDGVVKRKLDNLWTDWFECPYIEYPTQEQLQTVVLAFKAAIRSEPKNFSTKLGELAPGTKCVVVSGSDTKDSKTGYVYVRLAGEKGQWIVKTAIK